MSTYVNICFEIPDTGECDAIFDYLTEHPKDVWDYEKRVEQSFHAQGFQTNFLHEARWTDDDILHTRVTRLKFPRSDEDSNVIQYEVTLRRGASDPKVLVDLLRRCKSVQDGSVGGNWTIHAWYRGEEGGWTADAGNDGEAYYQTFGGFCESIGLHATPDQWNRIKQDRSRRMHRKHKEMDMIPALRKHTEMDKIPAHRKHKEMDMIPAMKELKTFLEGDYIRLGHTEDEDVVALKKAIDDVVAATNDAVQTALWVIESAIKDWLSAVLGDHDDASFEKARELCCSILTGIQRATEKRTRKNTRKHSNKNKNRDHFCDGMDAQDKGRCGCILTDRLKSSAKHIRNIIRRCRFLPLQDAGIQSLLRKIGLAPEFDSCTGRWELAGPVYECYLQTQPPKQTYIRDLMRLCKALWSYTKDGLQLDRETCTSFTTKYVLHYAIFRTIVSEVRQFVQTYPLPETAGDEPQEAQEPEVAVVRPHVIVIRFTHMNVQMLLGGMKELM